MVRGLDTPLTGIYDIATFDPASRVSKERPLRVCSLFPWYVGGMLFYYLFDLCFICRYQRELGRRSWGAVMEACVIRIAGLFAQYPLHIQLFFSFTTALAVNILYLALKSPYAYANLITVMCLPFSAIPLDCSLLMGVCQDKVAATLF